MARKGTKWCRFKIQLACVGLLGVTSHHPCMASPSTSLASGSNSATSTNAVTKSQVLAGLKAILERQTQALDAYTQATRQIVLESQKISVRAVDRVATEKHLQSIPDRLAHLQTKREEAQLRREFINQLILQVDSRWTGQALAGFLEQQLIEMAIADLTSPPRTDGTKSTLWKFYIYLSVAIREIPEPREDMIAFIAGYMEFSSIRDPRTPLAYADGRNYTNGSTSQAAQPISREELGIAVEKRMKELGLTEDKPPTMQLRLKSQPAGKPRPKKIQN